MEKLDDREIRLASPDEETANALIIGREAGETGIEAKNTSGDMTSPPLPWIGSLPRTSCGLMAVIGEEGCLVPLWTAGDLLRVCKIMWQATAD